MNSLYRPLRGTFLATSRGKHIGEYSYFHYSLIGDWSAFSDQLNALGASDFNVVKLNRRHPKFSLLTYLDFEIAPFPPLARSVSVNEFGSTRVMDYTSRNNPPILHRKELLLAADDPCGERAARLTGTLEEHGLLKNAKSIGTLEGWNRRLKEAGFAVRGDELIKL